MMETQAGRICTPQRASATVQGLDDQFLRSLVAAVMATILSPAEPRNVEKRCLGPLGDLLAASEGFGKVSFCWAVVLHTS